MLTFMMTMLLTNLKVAYFTFDDGPSTQTVEIMDVLDEYQVPGLFFVIGDYIEELTDGEEIIQQITTRGHQVGLHSMSHDRHQLYQQQGAGQHFADEMTQLQQKIYEITAQTPSVCRAPYSRTLYFTPLHYDALAKAKIDYLDWNVDSRDWSHVDVRQIIENVEVGIEAVADDSVIVLLFHETEETVEALPVVIKYLQQLGYQFGSYDSVTRLQELIEYK